MNRETRIRLQPEAVSRVDAIVMHLEAKHPGHRISREAIVRQVLAKALHSPPILRALGADPARLGS